MDQAFLRWFLEKKKKGCLRGIDLHETDGNGPRDPVFDVVCEVLLYDGEEMCVLGRKRRRAGRGDAPAGL